MADQWGGTGSTTKLATELRFRTTATAFRSSFRSAEINFVDGVIRTAGPVFFLFYLRLHITKLRIGLGDFTSGESIEETWLGVRWNL